MHTPLAHLHAGIAKECTRLHTAQHTSHTTSGHDCCRSTCPPCMSQPPLVLEFAEHSRELSRVSQVLFSCASFWQGLCFAVQIQRRSSSQPFTAPLTLLLMLQPSTAHARPVDYHPYRLDVSETQRLRPRPAPDVTGGSSTQSSAPFVARAGAWLQTAHAARPRRRRRK